jgi:hypothetical protein
MTGACTPGNRPSGPQQLRTSFSFDRVIQSFAQLKVSSWDFTPGPPTPYQNITYPHEVRLVTFQQKSWIYWPTTRN